MSTNSLFKIFCIVTITFMCLSRSAVQAVSPFEDFLEKIAESIESEISGEEPSLNLKSTEKKLKNKDKEYKSTHVQIASFSIREKNESIRIHTFCVDQKGNILVALGGNQVSYEMKNGKRVKKESSSSGELRVFSPEGEMLKKINLEITAQTVNVAPDGSIFVAGKGSVVHLDADGKLIAKVDLPMIKNRDKVMKACKKQAKEIIERQGNQYDGMIKSTKNLIEKLTTKPEKDRSKFQKKHIELAKKRLKILEEQAENSSGGNQSMFGSVDDLAQRIFEGKFGVSGIAITDKDVFVAAPGMDSFGYSIWRMTPDLKDPKVIVTKLRGCCGQMDIQAKGDDLWVAENSRHRVCQYNREGELISKFGKGSRTGMEGFSGCCNPMNVRIASNNEIYTSESSTGRIKRFNASGKMLAYVGKADAAEGCNHSAIGISPDGKQVYHINIQKNIISVLAPTQPEDKSVSDTKF